MQSIVIRNAEPADFLAICALNLTEVQHTSAMDMARLTELNTLSCFHKVACLDGIVAAFLLAMCNGSTYVNENFEWFSKRYACFIYVDRVVVSHVSRGLRLGSLLYEGSISLRENQGNPAGRLRVQYFSAQRTITAVSRQVGLQAARDSVGGKRYEASLASGRRNLSIGSQSEVSARAAIRREVASIRPADDLEHVHLSEALVWIDSGAPLFRTAKPATPPRTWSRISPWSMEITFSS